MARPARTASSSCRSRRSTTAVIAVHDGDGRPRARADRELARGLGQPDARRARLRDRRRARSSASCATRPPAASSPRGRWSSTRCARSSRTRRRPAQCARFLRARCRTRGASPAPRRPRRCAWSPTATSRGRRSARAVAAELYGCDVLREDVEDDPGNETRFVWLAPRGHAAPAPATASRPRSCSGAPATSGPGWLVRCLSEFAVRGVNLTRIESRPRRAAARPLHVLPRPRGRDGDRAVAGAVAGLRAHAEVVRVLGSFPAA